jgi:hypothetical protein
MSEQMVKDENSTKEDLSKINQKIHETKLKREPRDVKIINLSNIKHGHLDRMINESEKINSALKNQNLNFATPLKSGLETEVQVEKQKEY